MNEIILNANICKGLLSTVESEPAVPHPDVARWFSSAGTSVGKTLAARSRAGLRALQLRQCLNEDFIYPFTFSEIQTLGFYNHFNQATFKAVFVNVLVLVVAILRKHEQE
jgi:hypothetical protein